MARAPDPVPFYIFPYHEAREHGAKGIPALLWSSREGQRVRFEALARSCPLAGKRRSSTWDADGRTS